MDLITACEKGGEEKLAGKERGAENKVGEEKEDILRRHVLN